MDEVIGMDNPQQLGTPELFGLVINEDNGDNAEDQPEEVDESTRTSPQQWKSPKRRACQTPYNKKLLNVKLRNKTQF